MTDWLGARIMTPVVGTICLFVADIDVRQKCINLRHNLFAPILLLRHLFAQTMGIICANKIDIHLHHC